MALPVDLPIVLLRRHVRHEPSEYPVAMPSDAGHGWYEWIGSDVGGSDRLIGDALTQLRTLVDVHESDYFLALMASGNLVILGQCFTGTKPPMRTCISCAKERDEREYPGYTYRRLEDGGHSSKRICSHCLNAKNRERRQQAKESQGALLEH